MSYGPEVDDGEVKLVNIVPQFTSPIHHSNSLSVADSKFESMNVMAKGRNMWTVGFVMSQTGNLVCHPKQWRSKTSQWWNNFKKDSTIGDCVQAFLEYVNFTMSRDSSGL